MSKKKYFLGFFLLVLCLALVLPAKAALLDAWSDPFSDQQIGYNALSAIEMGRKDPRVIVANVIQVMMGFLGVLAVGLVLYGGFIWMTAHGDDQKVLKAKKILQQASIGLAIILSAFAIATYVVRVLSGATGAGAGQTQVACSSGTTRSCGCGGIQSCSGEGQWDGCQGSDCTFSGDGRSYCDGNLLTPTCDAESALCKVNQFCNPKDCRCSTGGGLGDSCDADTTNQACDAANDHCGQYLKCDPQSCTCLGTPVIEAISPVGGFCDANASKACLADTDCSGLTPATCNHKLPNGAVGNLFTIRGRYFGKYEAGVSKIFINGLEANLASAANANCSGGWQESQIIAVVPEGATMGAITVENASGKDVTNDNIGPKLADFQINNLQRPGLCQLSKNDGIFQDKVTYYGINLSGVNGYYGNYTQNILAESAFEQADAGTVTVPAIEAGETTTFVLAGNAVASNFLGFNKLQDQYSGPQIIAVEPASGPIGQYVTVRGSGFGFTQGSSALMFNNTPADTNFPAVCANAVWTDNEIVVKVPAGLQDGDYTVTIQVGAQKGEAPAKFKVDSKINLAPGLCKIDPPLVRINDEIKLYGEYFGKLDRYSGVQFAGDISWQSTSKICWGGTDDGKQCQQNSDCENKKCSLALGSWAQDKVGAKPYADKIITKVPGAAITGPVRVQKNQNNLFSNSLNLTIGQCIADSQCGVGNFCCQSGSPLAGTCQERPEKCFGSSESSVFEWAFDTKATGNCPLTKPNLCQDGSCCRGACILDDVTQKTVCSDGASCGTLADDKCLSANFCPNSPGNCSSNPNVKIKGSTCNCTVLGIKDGFYDATLNKCVDIAATCSLPKVFDFGTEKLQARCSAYQGVNRWQVSRAGTCPVGFTKATNKIGEKTCVNLGETCDVCSGKLQCIEKDGQGVCASAFQVCPGQLTCTDDVCQSAQSVCECCCDKKQNQVDGTNPSCCAPLTCDNSCGSGGDFGVCSGCTSVGSTQAEHDNACNCTGTFGKFCDASVPGGACHDCSQIGDPAECGLHEQCCVDAKHGNACVAVSETKVTGDDGVGYCGYYSCANNCSAPVANGEFKKADDCGGKCAITCNSNPLGICSPDSTMCPSDKPTCNDQCLCVNNTDKGPGESCAGAGGSCTLSCGTSYFCRGDQGCVGADCAGKKDESTCACCCNPDNKSDDPKAKDYDNCNDINPDLACTANKGTCTGDQRGLCCGCKADEDCGNAATTGCGKDACCHTKFKVSDFIPAHDAEAQCRNTAIKAVFSEPIDKNTVNGNVVLVGDYGAEVCPAGTTLLMAVSGPTNNNLLARMWRVISDFFGRLAATWVKPAAADDDHNFCVISSKIKSLATNVDVSLVDSVAITPDQPLEANTKYFVILKGDANQQSNSGILSDQKLGLLGENLTGVTAFNGVEYINGQIWSFTTGNDICQLSSVKIMPSQHLFRKPGEAITVVAAGYDRDGHELMPSSQYDWLYDWSVQNPGVVSVNVTDSPNNSMAMVTAANVKDDATTLLAKATITADDLNPMSTVGTTVTGRARMIVFLCANPWPAVTDPNAWPVQWLDNETNCTICTDPGTGENRPCVAGECLNNNFAIYYCRDRAGTNNDLPSLATDSPIRGRYTYKRANQLVDMLKEYNWYRSELGNPPSIVSAVTGTSPLGGQAVVTVDGFDDNVFKVYYSTVSGRYDRYVLSSESPVTISGLKNKTTYYFAATVVNTKQVESPYSDEAQLTVSDQVAPEVPAEVSAKVTIGANAKKIKLSWSKDFTDTMRYVLSYGPNKNPASKVNIGLTNNYTLDKLTNLDSVTYYLQLYREDLAGNKSAIVNITCEKGCSDVCDCEVN
jgi:hypothetical protein